MLLKELCDKRGVSGDEGDVRAFLKEKAQPLCDEVLVDALGNVICHKKGNGPRIMLAAHMDEVGLMVRGIEESGLIRFLPVGGIDPRVLVSKRVAVGDKQIPGIIGAKAIHLQTVQENQTALTMDKLYIDIGCDTKAEAEAKVSIGDTAVFVSDYVAFGDQMIKARALDDRGGCYVLLELLKSQFPCDLYVVFTAQEEVGSRGAMVAAHRIMPDMAIVVECTGVQDMLEEDEDKHLWVAEVGKGPAITYKDAGSISTPALRDAIIEWATENQVPWQPKRRHTGGNDASVIQLAGSGVPSAVVSVPARYIHSHSNVVSLKDVEATIQLIKGFLSKDHTALCLQLKGENEHA